MKLLLDMNTPPVWVNFFRANGVEAVHWKECGNPCAADSEIMDYAAAHSFTILTYDLDFSSILANTKTTRPSVIQVRRPGMNNSRARGAILSALRQCACAIESGCLLVIDPVRSRLRLLPL